MPGLSPIPPLSSPAPLPPPLLPGVPGGDLGVLGVPGVPGLLGDVTLSPPLSLPNNLDAAEEEGTDEEDAEEEEEEEEAALVVDPYRCSGSAFRSRRGGGRLAAMNLRFLYFGYLPAAFLNHRGRRGARDDDDDDDDEDPFCCTHAKAARS